jgi:Arc/MetJ-type ribon-helix-helix transcriptional regulator
VVTAAARLRAAKSSRSEPTSSISHAYASDVVLSAVNASWEGNNEAINLGYVDLGHIDLMVQEGFYSNRTDFIRTAIRNQLERHAEVVRRSIERKTLDLGLRHYSREDLEAARAAGQILRINVL